jgi:ubiquinone/menaquinone biosynthesis C-methylase UbiE
VRRARWSPQRLTAGFDQDAASYDRLVGLNPGYHSDLRDSAAGLGLPDGGTGARILDAGCGTGASTAALLAAAPAADVVAVDASPGMLARAESKPWPRRVRFVHAPVEQLAEAGVRGPFDGIFAAYLLRNVADPDATLRTLFELLRPGAPLVLHDYSLAPRRSARAIWHAVCWTVIIPAGRLATGDARLYRYLWRSALDFDEPDGVTGRLRRAGYTGVHTGTVGGWQQGIVHRFRALRPAEAV